LILNLQKEIQHEQHSSDLAEF